MNMKNKKQETDVKRIKNFNPKYEVVKNDEDNARGCKCLS